MRTLSRHSHLRPTSGDDRGPMRSFWKVFAALALMLPLGAFVAGNLVASAADDPAPRHTIKIDPESGTPTGTPTPRPRSAPTEAGSGGADDAATHDAGDDHGADDSNDSDDHGDDHGDD